MLTITKKYHNLKAAHRQWKHKGHCKYVHGENWAFDVTFAADSLDEEGFVVDFGKLRPIKQRLDYYFDHTLLISESDPNKEDFITMHHMGLADVRFLKDCSAEYLAEHVFQLANDILKTDYPHEANTRNLRVVRVVCFEDDKNSAEYSA